MKSNIMLSAVGNASSTNVYPLALNMGEYSVAVELFPAIMVQVSLEDVKVVRETVPPNLWAYVDNVLEANAGRLSEIQDTMSSLHGITTMYLQLLDYVMTDYPYHVTDSIFLIEAFGTIRYSSHKALQKLANSYGIGTPNFIKFRTRRTEARAIRNSKSWYKRGAPYGIYFRPVRMLTAEEAEYVVIYRNRLPGAVIQRLILGGNDG